MTTSEISLLHLTVVHEVFVCVFLSIVFHMVSLKIVNNWHNWSVSDTLQALKKIKPVTINLQEHIVSPETLQMDSNEPLLEL